MAVGCVTGAPFPAEVKILLFSILPRQALGPTSLLSHQNCGLFTWAWGSWHVKHIIYPQF